MSNHKEYVDIMGIPFINKTKEELLREDLYPRLKKEEKTFIVTANPEIVMETRKNNTYKEAVQEADFIVADGIGIVLASKRLATPLKERIAGFDLMVNLLEHADEAGLSCFLLGASESVNEKTVEYIKKTYQNIRIAGNHHGFFKEDDASIAELVRESNPDLIFVALGFPKQEYWITNYISSFHKGIFIGVGGSFDVLAGEVKRAPSIWIKLNLEWLYRIVKQPARIFRIVNVFKFIGLSLLKRK